MRINGSNQSHEFLRLLFINKQKRILWAVWKDNINKLTVLIVVIDKVSKHNDENKVMDYTMKNHKTKIV